MMTMRSSSDQRIGTGLSLSLSIWKPLELAAHKDLLLLITKLVSTTFFFVKSP
jgi:hypothetical protein